MAPFKDNAEAAICISGDFEIAKYYTNQAKAVELPQAPKLFFCRRRIGYEILEGWRPAWVFPRLNQYPRSK